MIISSSSRRESTLEFPKMSNYSCENVSKSSHYYKFVNNVTSLFLSVYYMKRFYSV